MARGHALGGGGPPAPAAGEARIRHTAIAVNFFDINQRRGGFYTADPATMPLILGNEAAGVVESVRPDVTAYPLQDAAEAHRDVESRRLAGSAVLLP